MKATPYELVFVQPPRTTVFPGVSGHVNEEDVEELLVESLCVLACVLMLGLFHKVVLGNSSGAETNCLEPHLSTVQEHGPFEGLHPNAHSDPLPQQSLTECLHLNAPQSTAPEEGLAEDLAPDVLLSAVSPVKDIQAGTSTSAVLKQDAVESQGQ